MVPLVGERASVTSIAGVTESAGMSRGLALLVAGAFFMEILDGTVIAPAAPYIAGINRPMGLAALLLAHRLVPDLRTAIVARLDWRGFALTATGVAALIVGIENLGKTSPAWAVGGIGLVVAATALTAGVLYFVNVSRPLLDLQLLRIPTYRITAPAWLGVPGHQRRCW